MTALVFDVIAVAVLALSVIECYKKGFVASLISFLGYAISCIGAYFGSRMLSEAIYRLFIRDRLLLQVETAVSGELENGIVAQVTAALNAIPQWFSQLVAQFSGGAEEIAGHAAISAEVPVEHLSTAVVDEIMYPLIYALLQGVCFLVLFFCLMIVLRVLVRLLRQIRYVPLLGTVNALAGGAVGFLKGALILLVIAAVLHFGFNLFGGSISFVSETDVQNSYFFRYLYQFPLFDGVNIDWGAVA